MERKQIDGIQKIFFNVSHMPRKIKNILTTRRENKKSQNKSIILEFEVSFLTIYLLYKQGIYT